MTWDNQSWRDSYDDWKLRSPDDEYGYYDDTPDHDCADTFSIVNDTAICDCCGESWWPSAEEKAAWVERCAEQDAWLRRQRRREFWRKLTWPIRWPIFRLLEKVWPRKSLSVLTDDEIPF